MARNRDEQEARVRLRLPAGPDVTLLNEWERSPSARGEFNDLGQAASSFETTAAEGRFVTDDHGLLLVERLEDGVPLGTVSWRPSIYGPDERSRAWQLGISLIPEARGQGYGPEVLRLLALHLFATTNANRIEGQTDVGNLAARRALERAGFTAEGVARGSQFRAGKHHDLLVYSLLRSEMRGRLPTIGGAEPGPG
jgi:RimJ/RimL family protein N-acetyltransferase